MATYSPFWHKHYKDIGFCCTFQPLTDSPVEMLPNKPHVDYYIDTQWMRDKKLKWIGTNRNLEAAWIDPYGMVYTFNDLKRNERGKEYEKKNGKLKLIDHSGIRQYSDKKIDHYEWELKILKKCGFCDRKVEQPTPDEKEKKGGEGGGPPVVDEEGLEALMSGDNSEYTDVTFSDQVTDSDEVLSSATEEDDSDDAPQNDEEGDGEMEEDDEDDKPKDEDEYKFEEEKKEEKLKEEKPPQKLKVAPPLYKNPVVNAQKVLNQNQVLNNKLVTETPFKQTKHEEEQVPYPNVKFEMPKMQHQPLMEYKEFRYSAPPQVKQEPKKKKEDDCPQIPGLFIPVVPGTDPKTSEAFKVLTNIAGKYRNFINVDQSGHVEVPDNPKAEFSDAGYDLLHAIASNSSGKKILFTVADQLEGRDRDTGTPVRYSLYRERNDSYIADMNFSQTPRGDKPRNNTKATIDLHKLADAIPVKCFDGSVAIPTKSGVYKDTNDGSPRSVFYAKEKSKASLAFHALAENYYRTVENWRFPHAHDLAILWARKLSPNHPAFSLFPGQGVAIKLKDLYLSR